METDDGRWLAMAAAGDEASFGSIVHAHQERLLGYAERMLGSRDSALDAVQETFLRLWGARHRYSAEGGLDRLLLCILRNICLDELRKAPLRSHELTEGVFDPSPGPDAEASGRALRQAVRCAVLALPPEQREVFVLTQYLGLTYPETADTLGCPVNTIASRRHAAVMTLRRRLRSWTGEEE